MNSIWILLRFGNMDFRKFPKWFHKALPPPPGASGAPKKKIWGPPGGPPRREFAEEEAPGAGGNLVNPKMFKNTGGELFDKLYEQPGDKFSEGDARDLAIKMLSALNYLHENKIILDWKYLFWITSRPRPSAFSKGTR